ncbi:ABC-type spermidine/putrescine transport system, ATPase component [Aequorivita sublithincola DSM 14238]|uniref:ABC-type spermidine/putrescine transport system, ATPase component n=1 Tax=Aequorivita sublithincola (strain DSM 14238 / LMG 21431 / ACAM 643 / 9-3) TaxID=746697 RepID=I3YUF1_AEQSU|nr:ABC transporter ATP-binding protein [Aequorivita sublithincola]AFL80619.1 ABC-type spermidine/putrescine transport system, ATPase component [Aequorivita sublithincola DSM 14238]
MLKVEINSFSYSEKTILKDIDFTLKPGEHLSILGESGCGKSTLLHLVYGLLHLELGSIYFNDKKLLGPTKTLIPGESFMKLVAQEFNIMPFTTVTENLGSHLSGLEEEKDAQRIDELLEVVEMEAFKNTLVKNLSGGQKQRVALAKALANTPEILLLDEPFSNIDTFRKNKLQRKIFSYLKENNISCITATHDSDEALAFSDHILMLKNGTKELFGTPEFIYKNVSTEYQAGFFGEANLLPNNLFSTENSSEEIIVFPHQLKISEEKTQLKVSVKKSYFKGNHYLIESDFKDKTIFFNNQFPLKKGTICRLKISEMI